MLVVGEAHLITHREATYAVGILCTVRPVVGGQAFFFFFGVTFDLPAAQSDETRICDEG